jgi:hypothetical protein
VNYMSLIKFKRGTKANLPTLAIAEPAMTTDTKELFIGTNEGNVQIGDMLKSVYDINGNGVVDDAEKLGGQAGSYYLDRANHTGTIEAAEVSDFAEAAQDAVGGMISNTGRTVTLTYNDAAATLYADVLFDDATIKKNGTDQLYVVDGTTLVKGVVKLVDSTTSDSTITAATPNSVKTVQDNLGTHINDATAHGIDEFLIKDVSAGTNVTIDKTNGVATINVPTIGETNTAANANTLGVGVYDSKVGAELKFKGVQSSDSSLSVTDVPASKSIDVKHGTVTTTSSSGQTGATVVKSVTVSNGHVTDYKTGSLGVADVSGAAAQSDLTHLATDVDTLKSSGIVENGTIVNNNDGSVTLNNWVAYFAPSRTEVTFNDVDVVLNGTDGPKVVYLLENGTVSVGTSYNVISDPSSVLLMFVLVDGTTLSPMIVMPDMVEVQEIMRAYLEMIEIPVYKLDLYTKTTSLELGRNSGSLLIEGINYTSNGSQNLKTLAADATIDLLYFNVDGAIALPITYATAIDPDNYYDGSGTPAIEAVPTGKFTVQEIRANADGKYFVRYGATLYDNLLAAKEDIFTATFAPMDNIYSAISTPVARLAVGEGSTDLSDAAQAYLVKVAAVGGTAAGSGSGGGGTVSLPISDADNLLYASANPNAQARFIVSGTSAYTHTLPAASGTLVHSTDVAELAQDAVGGAISNAATSAVTLTYNDGANTFSADAKVDATTIVKNETTGNLEVGAITSAKVSDFVEAAQDAVGGAISNNVAEAVTLTYNDTSNTFSADAKVDDTTIEKNASGQLKVKAVTSAAVSDFAEAAQDAVGAMIVNTGKAVTLTYTDGSNSLSAEANIDDATIKKNGSNQLYVDTIDGGTF